MILITKNFNTIMILILKTGLAYILMNHIQSFNIHLIKPFQIFMRQAKQVLEDSYMIKIGLVELQLILLVNVRIANKKFHYFR